MLEVLVICPPQGWRAWSESRGMRWLEESTEREIMSQWLDHYLAAFGHSVGKIEDGDEYADLTVEYDGVFALVNDGKEIRAWQVERNYDLRKELNTLCTEEREA